MICRFRTVAWASVSISTLPAISGCSIAWTIWSRSASTDDTNEIFITPFESDSKLILATITHEAIHAIDDNKSGHKGFFAHVARKAGLIGKLTATTANDELNEYFTEVIDILGNIPHAKLDVTKRPNIQTGRMVKVSCPACDFKFNTSRSQITRITNYTCMVCSEQMIVNVK